jgi:ornithine cyclodeaminase/alanine dehydrogenase-like protein (mu-crystallin family)
MRGATLPRMSPALPPLRYLGAADVRAAMPPIEERLGLAELTMRALVAEAELPPKIGVHPRPAESFAHAMPAFLRGADASGAADGLGMKWVAGFPGNPSLGLPGIHALVLLNDPSTGVPIAVLDGGPITAQRTAAVSGIAIRRFAPAVEGRAARVGLVGAGVQGHSHLAVVAHLLPECRLRVFDRDPARSDTLAAEATALPGIGAAESVGDAREATADADVVITAAAFGPVRQVMTNDWLARDALVVPVDYATYAAAEVARDAALFLVDERDQFLANRAAGLFDGYPDPAATLGEAILDGIARPAGRVVVTHLGVGLADVVFARAILRAAEERGLGTELPR